MLIDFGLLAPLLPDARDAAALAGLSGTIAYMAPEQLWGGPVGEASDWYAVGGLLFHALFGRAPFPGSMAEIATAKTIGAAPVVPDGHRVPPWLEALVLDLLSHRPTERPSGDEIESRIAEACGQADRRVRERSLPPRASGWSLESGSSTAFYGREAELAALREAFDGARESGLTLVRVSGPSGIGKTELLRRFAAVVERECGAVVLRGRCHPYETIPRKGLDQAVDDLSRHLQLDDSSCAELAADEASALGQLFPVLGRVPSIAAATNRTASMDPQVVRETGMAAFARLLSRIARSRPLVVWIDDAQWADDESAAVLGRFLRGGATTHAVVLLSYRPEAEEGSALLDLTADPSSFRLVPAIVVPPLDGRASRQLVAELASGSAGDITIDAERVVAEAAGSPFFLAEIVRSVRVSAAAGDRVGRVPRIDEVVALRYRALPAAARGVLDVVAMAGAPLSEEVSIAASGLAAAWQALADLERECLVRSVDSRDGRRIQPYHDRIAEGVRAQLDAARRDAIHGSLIDALEQEPEADHELLVHHCTAARQMAKAARHAAPAALRAATALAFDRAVELYRLALEHGDESLERASLQVGLAEALANAGRGEEAAVAFEDAARAASPATVDLRRRGAEQLLRCGRVDEGIARMREVLAQLGERLPETSGEAMRSFLWQRLRLGLHGTQVRPARRTLDESSAARLDAMWSTTIAVSMVDLGLAGAVQARHFLEALDFRDPDRLSLALAHEATWRSCLGPRLRRSAQDALLEARRLAGDAGRSYPLAWTSMAEGIVHWQSGRFAAAVPCLDQLAGYRLGCRGVFFEIALTAMYQFAALALSGRIGRLVELVESETDGARRRRDRFAHHGCLMGEAVHARLAADEPEIAIAHADAAIAEWPAHRFLMPHYQHVVATVQADLYRGAPSSAWRRLENAWKQLRGAGYLWLECPSLGLWFLRARAALGRVRQEPDPVIRRSMLREARRAERRLRRSDLVVASAFAATIRAGIHHAEGDLRAAGNDLLEALASYRAAGMTMHAAACDHTLHRLEPQRATIPEQTALRWASEEGWRDLDRLADSVVPLPAS